MLQDCTRSRCLVIRPARLGDILFGPTHHCRTGLYPSAEHRKLLV